MRPQTTEEANAASTSEQHTNDHKSEQGMNNVALY